MNTSETGTEGGFFAQLMPMLGVLSARLRSAEPGDLVQKQ